MVYDARNQERFRRAEAGDERVHTVKPVSSLCVPGHQSVTSKNSNEGAQVQATKALNAWLWLHPAEVVQRVKKQPTMKRRWTCLKLLTFRQANQDSKELNI